MGQRTINDFLHKKSIYCLLKLKFRLDNNLEQNIVKSSPVDIKSSAVDIKSTKLFEFNQSLFGISLRAYIDFFLILAEQIMILTLDFFSFYLGNLVLDHEFLIIEIFHTLLWIFMMMFDLDSTKINGFLKTMLTF